MTLSLLQVATPQEPLVILDLANNHNGSVDHGKRIIADLAGALSGVPLRIAVKFQYRELDTFIHPDYRGRLDLKYVKRFLSTRLSRDEFADLAAFAREHGFLTAATPFDEPSVQRVQEHGHDILKVASASFTDWPLWEAIAATRLPIVASTAGASLVDIDRVVAFLGHRSRDFALMHCVAAYPTHDDDLLLDRIDVLRTRYGGVPIGYSTHEDPGNLTAVVAALAKGCVVLERHVGESTPDAPLNDYSSDPTLVRQWTDRALSAGRMLGGGQRLAQPNQAEVEALRGLRRGVFVSSPVAEGSRVVASEVFFAIPLQDGQVSANDWSKYLSVTSTVPRKVGEPLLWADIETSDRNDEVVAIVEAVTQLLDEAGVVYPTSVDMEISHHYGLDAFPQFGLSMITVVNREYCKKLLVLLPGQEHPEQWHDVKEETFHVLHGDVSLWLDGAMSRLGPGDVVVIEPGSKHRFRSTGGAVVEEISMRHEVNDSFYVDEAINANAERKTYVSFWGSLGAN